ncbi:centrosomal protein CEP57L1 isoform X4 [Cavia porcellus]
MACSVNADRQHLQQKTHRCGSHILPKRAQEIEPRCLCKPPRTVSQYKAVPCESENSISICDSLSELLMAMQDELDQMSMEHEELLKQMKETETHSVCDDIECELERLVEKMEIKGKQISKLKKHQDKGYRKAAMDDIYRVTSTERTQLLEEELAARLSELKSEIEEPGILQGTAPRVYSSMQVPKDISYFRRERELALKKTLQVAEAKPLVIQADVLQRELESCLRREYTPENLPLLLLQYYTGRIVQLAQSKYLHMLRWKRFCQHSTTMEQLYPLYKKQVAYIMQEYRDAAQRAERLSVARENFLLGKRNPANLVTQADLTIYTRWLVCHLHSLGTIHLYLQALQCLPISRVLDLESSRVPGANQEQEKVCVSDISPDTQDPASPGSVDSSISGPVGADATFVLPRHVTEAGELKPQLKSLLSHFQIPYDVRELRDPVTEMELFSLVSQHFQSIFVEQQQMQTFLDYETGVTKAENLGLSGPAVTLKKRANWIPFMKIKPKCDPWQKKMLTKLKEQKRIDVLMQIQAKFLKISDSKRVMQVLQDHASKTDTRKPHHPPFVAAQGLHHCTYDKIWENIYSNINLYQDVKYADFSTERDEKDPAASLRQVSATDGPVRQRKDAGYSFKVALQRLGLDGTDEDSPALLRGAHLSFLCLRHLRIRELQRICLGILNYFRSVERTLTISTSGLTLVSGTLVPTAEDSSWVNIAGGGLGTSQGLGAHRYVHGTPAEHKVHSIQFMEFSEVDNQDDHYSVGAGCIHTQDQQGAYVMYDEALRDLQDLEAELLLVGSHYIKKEKGAKKSSSSESNQAWGWTQASVDRFAVLYDLWTWEAAFLGNKHQLLDCYFEAYQHALDPEERFALAQVITDIMHQRPKFDLDHPYFIKAYKEECVCLRLHLQLVRSILNQQIENQTEYVQRLWRDDHPDVQNTFGIPLNIVCQQPNSISNICPALRSMHLLEFHPSLGLAGLIPRALEHLQSQAHRTHRPASPSARARLERRVLQLALDLWLTPTKPEAWYSAQLQRDLFSAKVMGDPFLVEEIGLRALGSAVGEGHTQGHDARVLLLETFAKLLELLTLRHRLVDMSLESAHLARLYKKLAQEMGFEEFHLYLRPVQFEFAAHRDKTDPSAPVFMTSLLEDSGRVDRYSPSTLVLAISEVDDNQIGKFSFYTEEAILKLLSHSGVENMQVILACQAAQKNALMVAVQQAAFYHTLPEGLPSAAQGGPGDAEAGAPPPEISSNLRTQGVMSPTRRSPRTVNGRGVPDLLPHSPERVQTTARAPEAFVSIQLEKVGLRDLMLDAFLLRKQTMGDRMKGPDATEKVKRELIIEYCQKFNRHMSHYAFRAQIMSYCSSLRALLEDFPVIKDTFFMMGQAQDKKGPRDFKEDLKADPRGFQCQPRSLLSADGQIVLNLWFIPHPAEVLLMFRALPEEAALRALKLTLQLIASLHDIVAYLVSFTALGHPPACREIPLGPHTLRDSWGGAEDIGTELQELQKMLDSLQDPRDPALVAQALCLHREVLFLQFDGAVRHLVRGRFLAAGNIPAYQAVTDGMHHGLPPLGSALVRSMFAAQLSLPQPLDPQSLQASVLFPWRAFLEDGGPFPAISCTPDTFEYSMQQCLCGLSDSDHKVAHGELVAMRLLMDDVLSRGPHTNGEASPGCQATVTQSRQPDGIRGPRFRSELPSSPAASAPLEGRCDPVAALAQLRTFLLLWKQLEVLKEHWGRLRLHAQDLDLASRHQQLSALYEADILYPSMRALARQMGKEEEFEGSVINSQSVLPPKGASETEIKTQQLRKLLEETEIHMIQEVLRKVHREMTLVLSEKSRKESTLPTDLWKHQVMKENFSVIRPQIVENFVQRLLQNQQDSGSEVTLRKEHLEACLLSLGCDVMARERSSFETYSMCYEHILQHARQRLHQREQELDVLQRSQVPPEDHAGQVAELSHDLIMELTGLRAQLTDLEEENMNLKKQTRKEVQEEYEALVQALFVTSLNIKEKLDENQLTLMQHVRELIGEVRTEGIARMEKLKEKWGSARPDRGPKENPAEGQVLEGVFSASEPGWQEQLQALEQENSQLDALLCKVRSLERWRLAVLRARFRGQLSRAEKESIQSKKECSRIKLMAEQEASLFRQQLLALRQALARARADNERLWRQLNKQAQLLKESEHRASQEALARQQLDSMKTSSMEKLQEDARRKEQQLQLLTEEAERASKLGRLQRRRLERELLQVRPLCTLSVPAHLPWPSQPPRPPSTQENALLCSPPLPSPPLPSPPLSLSHWYIVELCNDRIHHREFVPACGVTCCCFFPPLINGKNHSLLLHSTPLALLIYKSCISIFLSILFSCPFFPFPPSPSLVSLLI